MGYEDREYMRTSGSERSAQRGSHPLWWILGLIALILVVSFFRRGSMPSPLPATMEQWVEESLPVRACEIELATDSDAADRVLPLLRAYFRQQGYDSTIHETADDSLTTAEFSKHQQQQRLSHHVTYRRIADHHKTQKPRHVLAFFVTRMGVPDPGPSVAQSHQQAETLRLQLEQELPGVVVGFDDTEERMPYHDHEFYDWP